MSILHELPALSFFDIAVVINMNREDNVGLNIFAFYFNFQLFRTDLCHLRFITLLRRRSLRRREIRYDQFPVCVRNVILLGGSRICAVLSPHIALTLTAFILKISACGLWMRKEINTELVA